MIRHVTAFLATVLLILTGNAFGAAPANDNFANATILNQTVPFSVNGTNVSSTAESSEPHHAGAAAAKSVWYSWTPANTISIMLSTSGSALDTTLAVYTGSALNALTVVASNADIVTPSNTASQVSFSATGETTYYIAIDGNNASENTFTPRVLTSDNCRRRGARRSRDRRRSVGNISDHAQRQYFLGDDRRFFHRRFRSGERRLSARG